MSAQVPQLSPQAEISVITCSPGEAIFEAFGHNAFRVYDPINRIDYAYNYGIFDFDQPNFYVNFMKGHLLYRLGRNDYKRFVAYYVYFDRTVTEQTLNLSQEQKQHMFKYLEENNLPENQEYLYDYYYNNCATKIRDVIEIAIQDSIIWNDSYVKEPMTIRELQNSYLQQMPWGRFGINLIMGSPTDKTAASYEYMYLPEYVLKAVDEAIIVQPYKPKLLLKDKIITHKGANKNSNSRQLWVLWVLLAIVILFSFWHFKKGLAFAYFDLVLFGIAGIGGTVLLSIWLFTDHHAAANNYNVLWLLPTHLVAAILLPFYYRTKWLRHYFIGSAILTALMCVFWKVIPQELLLDFLPLMLILMVRSAYIGWVTKLKKAV